MKQDVFIHVTAPLAGTLSTREVFQNRFEEKLLIHNACMSRVFEEPVLADGEDRPLPLERIPVQNGRDFHYAAKLIDPVLPGRKYVVKTSVRLSAAYFENTTVLRQGLYFWQVRHASVVPVETVFRVSLAECFELVHVHGPIPRQDAPGTLEWECTLDEGRPFHPLVVYREKTAAK
jgi:hypothetical protein